MYVYSLSWVYGSKLVTLTQELFLYLLQIHHHHVNFIIVVQMQFALNMDPLGMIMCFLTTVWTLRII